MPKYDNSRNQSMLQGVITELSQNPKEKRSTSKGRGFCKYYPTKKTSKGCAVGMYLSYDVAKKLDKFEDGSISGIMEDDSKLKLLPKWMQKMNPEFLLDLQGFHDTNYFWDENNISEEGKEHVKLICSMHNLDFSKIKFKK